MYIVQIHLFGLIKMFHLFISFFNQYRVSKQNMSNCQSTHIYLFSTILSVSSVIPHHSEINSEHFLQSLSVKIVNIGV